MTVALYSVSAELANEHLDRHEESGCRSTGYYDRVTYRCAHDGALAAVIECGTCGVSLACIVDGPACEHLSDLLDGLGMAA